MGSMVWFAGLSLTTAKMESKLDVTDRKKLKAKAKPSLDILWRNSVNMTTKLKCVNLKRSHQTVRMMVRFVGLFIQQKLSRKEEFLMIKATKWSQIMT